MNPIPYHRLHRLHELSEAGFTELQNEQNWETSQQNKPLPTTDDTNYTDDKKMHFSVTMLPCFPFDPSTLRLRSGITDSKTIFRHLHRPSHLHHPSRPSRPFLLPVSLSHVSSFRLSFLTLQ